LPPPSDDKKEVSGVERAEVFRVIEPDHQILARLVTGRSVDIDDKKQLAVERTRVGPEQDRVVCMQMARAQACGKVGVEAGCRQRSVIAPRVDAADAEATRVDAVDAVEIELNQRVVVRTRRLVGAEIAEPVRPGTAGGREWGARTRTP
jgi:hypothetical protein